MFALITDYTENLVSSFLLLGNPSYLQIMRHVGGVELLKLLEMTFAPHSLQSCRYVVKQTL